MTKEQEQHLEGIMNYINANLPPKYRKGQEEHGGNLWEKDCLPLAMEEALDMPVYLISEMKRRDRALKILDDFIVFIEEGGLLPRKDFIGHLKEVRELIKPTPKKKALPERGVKGAGKIQMREKPKKMVYQYEPTQDDLTDILKFIRQYFR